MTKSIRGVVRSVRIREGARVVVEASRDYAEDLVEIYSRFSEGTFIVNIESADVPIRFIANFPGLQTDLTVGRDSVKVKIDVPESEKREVLKLIAYALEQEVEISFEEDSESGKVIGELREEALTEQ